MSDAVRGGDSSRAVSRAGEGTRRRRYCMLAERAGRHEPCSSECALWEEGGAVIPAGCALERMLGEEDWPPELAQRWLGIRDRVSKDEWKPTSFLAALLN